MEDHQEKSRARRVDGLREGSRVVSRGSGIPTLGGTMIWQNAGSAAPSRNSDNHTQERTQRIDSPSGCAGKKRMRARMQAALRRNRGDGMALKAWDHPIARNAGDSN
jgi:hypothetical protein